MRFYSYINEKQSYVDEYIETIKKDCKPYLDLLKKERIGFFYRGAYTSKPFEKKDVRKNRKPQGTKKSVFVEINKLLEKNKHVRRDQSIMVTSDKNWAKGFGNMVYMVFPIGRFDYSWISLIDFNKIQSEAFAYNFAGPESMGDYLFGEFDLISDKEKKEIEDYLLGMITTNKGIKKAYVNGFEVWMNPKSYYLLLPYYDSDEETMRKELL